MAFVTDNEILALIEKYKRLEIIVEEKMNQTLAPESDSLMFVTHRVKTMDSIKGKLKRKQDRYTDIHDMRDILGFRVICYFSSDVDVIAKLIADNFCVNWEKSKDKRKLIDARSFGYLSLHYICKLPEAESDLKDLWFEVQIMTILQHGWAAIEHDLGYKSDIEVPREIRRSFSRAASLLETTDVIFSQIKQQLIEYRSTVKKNIENESLNDMSFDIITLTEFTANNSTYLNLLNEIAAITDAHITEGNLENLLAQIDFLKIYTLQDMIELINTRRELALKLARKSLQGSELDELSSTVAYHFLFRAELVGGGYSRERIREFFMLSSYNEKRVENNTEKIMKARTEQTS